MVVGMLLVVRVRHGRLAATMGQHEADRRTHLVVGGDGVGDSGCGLSGCDFILGRKHAHTLAHMRTR